MSGIPPLPPLRIKESDGSPNVIPVFQITLSNGLTLTNEGGGKVKIDGSGSQGPAGPAGTVTLGSGITGGATDGFLLMVSNGATLGQVTSGAFQRAIPFPVIVTSGGSGLSAAGSGTMLVGMNSSGVVYDYYLLKASDNMTIVRNGSSYLFSATTGASGTVDTSSLVQNTRAINTTYPLSGGGNLTADRMFLIQTGLTGQVLATSAGVTGGIYWANTLGGSAGAVYAATGNRYIVTDFESDLTNDFRLVQSGNNITIDTTGNLIVINATTGGGSSNSKTIIGQGATGTSATRYGTPFGSTLDASSALVAIFKVPFNGIAKNLYFAVQTSAGAPASSRAWIGQVIKNSVITALTANCFEVIASASDLTNTVSFSSGDILTFGYERFGTAAGPGFLSINFEYDPT